jgi:hypothetical protein
MSGDRPRITTGDEQTPGIVAARRLQDAWVDVAGFAGLTYVPTSDGVVLYWHGERPVRLELDVEAVRRAGIEVELIDAAFTAQELVAESGRLIRAYVGGFPRITVAGPRFDGGGVNVSLAEGTLAEAERLGVDVSALLSQRYPVTVEGEANPVPA